MHVKHQGMESKLFGFLFMKARCLSNKGKDLKILLYANQADMTGLN